MGETRILISFKDLPKLITLPLGIKHHESETRVEASEIGYEF
jgi:hypothetical protein